MTFENEILENRKINLTGIPLDMKLVEKHVEEIAPVVVAKAGLDLTPFPQPVAYVLYECTLPFLIQESSC